MSAVVLNTSETSNVKAEKKAQDSNAIPPYFIAFFLFLGSINLTQESIINDSKEVGSFNSAQSVILKNLNSLDWMSLPKNPSETKIHQLNEANKEISAEQACLQQQLMGLRQGGQVKLTMTNTTMDVLQQIAGMSSSVLQVLHTTYDLIQKIAPVNIA